MVTKVNNLAQRETSPSRPTQGIVYLAAPYSDPDPEVRLARYEMATMAAAALAAEGLVVFSPLTMTHPMDILMAGSGKTLGSDHWVAFDEAFMEVCSEIRVLALDGWDQSRGVKREMQFFKERGRPITMVSPTSLLPGHVQHGQRNVSQNLQCSDNIGRPLSLSTNPKIGGDWSRADARCSRSYRSPSLGLSGTLAARHEASPRLIQNAPARGCNHVSANRQRPRRRF